MRARGAPWDRAVRAAAPACCAVLALAAALLAHGQAATDSKHLGVASCASSVCHGKALDKVRSSSQKCDRKYQSPRLHEYLFFTDCDLHAQAYALLGSEKSKSIAAKLGLPNATTAKICLDCHADNVPKAQQGPKYRVSDGIGCEACHGGSEKWIDTHKNAKHSADVALGMYPSEQPLKRAELCLSCHLGTRDKFATHVIMGAGHPRLSFELEAYTVLQPAHFLVDDDYIGRKGMIAGMNLWLTGQLEDAERTLTLLQSPLLTPGGMIPELSFYDCYACHHSKEKMHWSAARAGPGIKPGTLRLQKQPFVMLQAYLEAVGSADAAAQLASGTDELVRAGQVDPATLRAAAQKLLNELRTLEPATRREYSPADVAKVRKALLRFAAQDRASDFVTAEQVVLGVDSLSHSLKDDDRHKAPLDTLYAAVKSGSDFNATQFADLAKRVQDQF